MLFNIISKFKSALTPVDEQQAIDKFITEHNPTSVADVEHLIKVYDQRLYTSTNNNSFIYNL